MRVLGIDSSGRLLSVALVDEGRVLAATVHAAGRAHAERMLPAVREVLRRAGGGGRPGLVAVAQGPGSFTGLRAGVMTARTLAYIWRVAVLGLSGLDVLAWQAAVAQAGDATAAGADVCRRQVFCPLLDARRGQAYAALYARAGPPARGDEAGSVTLPFPADTAAGSDGGHGLRRLTAHRVWDPEELGAELGRLAGRFRLLCRGDVDPEGEFFSAMIAAARRDFAVEWPTAADREPGAVGVARLAWETVRRAPRGRGGTDPLQGPLPLYLRRPAARAPRGRGGCPD